MTVQELIEKLQEVATHNPNAPVDFMYNDSDEGECFGSVEYVVLTKDGVVLR